MAPTVSSGLSEVAWRGKGFDISAHRVPITDYITRRDDESGKTDDGNGENKVGDAATPYLVSDHDLDDDPNYPIVTPTDTGDALSDTEATNPQTTTTPSPTETFPLYTIILWFSLALDFSLAFSMAIMRQTSNNRGGIRRWLQLPLWIIFYMIHEPFVGFVYLLMALPALIWRFVRKVPCGSGWGSQKTVIDTVLLKDTPWCPYFRFKATTFDYARGGAARRIRAMLEPASAPTTEAPPPSVST